ncbi:MAG: GNAT family N-acetyltransferase [Acidobacteriaceae bacterium]
MSEIEACIFRGTVADAGDLSRLSAALFPLGCPANTKPEDLADYIQRELTPERFCKWLEDERTVILVVKVAEEFAGYALIAPGSPPSQSPAHAQYELRKFYIDAAYHGRGTSDALMKEVIMVADGRWEGALWLSVFSENPRAISFYKRWGFRIVGTQDFLVGADSQKDYLMCRTDADRERQVI